MKFALINPANGRVLRVVDEESWDSVDLKLDRARAAVIDWYGRGIERRAKALGAVTELMVERKNELALTAVREMGKPLSQASGELDKCIEALSYWSRPSGWPRWRRRRSDGEVVLAPLGVIFGIMPWNFPFWQVIRFAGPPLLIGNTVVVKPAPGTIGCQRLLQQCFDDAGVPPGVVSTLEIDVPATERCLADPRVAAVSLTGSGRAGRAVAEACGRSLKKCVLELGGSDPFIVFEDADIEAAVAAAVQSRMINGGQSCVSAKRFIVVDEVHDRFVRGMTRALQSFHGADPESSQTRLGPLAREDLRQSLHRQVLASVERGARVECGGEIPKGLGFFYPATVLSRVVPGQPAFDEELFGPVAAVVRAEDRDQAIELANRSRFGLGATIFSADEEGAKRLARDRIEAGMVFVNRTVQSEVGFPFGGIKESGFGRELGRSGFLEFANIKVIRWSESAAR